ncbi:hypothetical protein [Archangium lansingense]|uniref:Uncharacterized protein n=1 Tax=Archangium lansingense TaxID=2995310 RepID=A0ABT4A6N6_9BACT|nr:hypothetical protein [Archangium lansinium]MCY1077324.1 hypothetical protein [Archangium lansinium]
MKRWKNHPKFQVHWETKAGGLAPGGGPLMKKVVSEPFNQSVIERAVKTKGSAFAEALHLPEPRTEWLDGSVPIFMGFHYTDGTGDSVKIQIDAGLGDKFPLMPVLDREGVAEVSFQTSLLRSIAELRKRIVDTSVMGGSDQWSLFTSFRMLMAESVSLIDNTLHQLYFKAQYDPLPSWRFNVSALGPRHGVRVMDKLKWVYSITGVPLDARDQVTAFTHVKTVMNHFAHMDPPCMCFTMEEAADWLNKVRMVAELNWRIRQAVGGPPSLSLIELLLQPEVEFVPIYPNAKRIPPPTVGYASVSEATLIAKSRDRT